MKNTNEISNTSTDVTESNTITNGLRVVTYITQKETSYDNARNAQFNSIFIDVPKDNISVKFIRKAISTQLDNIVNLGGKLAGLHFGRKLTITVMIGNTAVLSNVDLSVNKSVEAKHRFFANIRKVLNVSIPLAINDKLDA